MTTLDWPELLQAKAQVAIELIIAEYGRAVSQHQALNSAYEGYGVLLEEVDELWEEVRKKKQDRRRENLEEEAAQVGAMAMRFIVDICLKEVPMDGRPAARSDRNE